MTLFDQYRDPEGGFRYEDCWYEDEQSLVLSGVLGFCGCGMPEEAAQYVRAILEHIDAGMRLPRDGYEKWAAHGETIGSKGALYFAYYVLDDKGFIEHGGAVPGWLTEKGKRLLEMLRALPDEESS